jgi:hypothetical protein
MMGGTKAQDLFYRVGDQCRILSQQLKLLGVSDQLRFPN